MPPPLPAPPSGGAATCSQAHAAHQAPVPLGALVGLGTSAPCHWRAGAGPARLVHLQGQICVGCVAGVQLACATCGGALVLSSVCARTPCVVGALSMSLGATNCANAWPCLLWQGPQQHRQWGLLRLWQVGVALVGGLPRAATWAPWGGLPLGHAHSCGARLGCCGGRHGSPLPPQHTGTPGAHLAMPPRCHPADGLQWGLWRRRWGAPPAVRCLHAAQAKHRR